MHIAKRRVCHSCLAHACIMGQSHPSPRPSPVTGLLFTHIFLCWTPPVWEEWRAKSEIRNPKSETNSNEQRSKSSKPSRRGRADWSGFEDSSFEFGACFGFRISDFGFVLRLTMARQASA